MDLRGAFAAPLIWRNTSFGAGSGDGLRAVERRRAPSSAVERRLTVGETCRQQGRNVLPYLTAALTAARAGHPAPQLLTGS